MRLREDGSTAEVRAGLVVGADGRHSTVAEEVGADEYLAHDAPRAMYWAYWDAPDAWGSDAYPFGMYLGHRDRHVRVVFQTDHDQLLIGSLPPVHEARGWRENPLASLRGSLSSDPVTGELVAGPGRGGVALQLPGARGGERGHARRPAGDRVRRPPAPPGRRTAGDEAPRARGVAQGRRASAFRRELERRERLLEEVGT